MPATQSITQDLIDTLARLRIAREVGHTAEAKITERRLNWLIDKLPRKQDSTCSY